MPRKDTCMLPEMDPNTLVAAMTEAIEALRQIVKSPQASAEVRVDAPGYCSVAQCSLWPPKMRSATSG